jgi:hypothetical protein
MMVSFPLSQRATVLFPLVLSSSTHIEESPGEADCPSRLAGCWVTGHRQDWLRCRPHTSGRSPSLPHRLLPKIPTGTRGPCVFAWARVRRPRMGSARLNCEQQQQRLPRDSRPHSPWSGVCLRQESRSGEAALWLHGCGQHHSQKQMEGKRPSKWEIKQPGLGTDLWTVPPSSPALEAAIFLAPEVVRHFRICRPAACPALSVLA